ncbi:unnamed protein product, partial [Trichogramma brassicae]
SADDCRSTRLVRRRLLCRTAAGGCSVERFLLWKMKIEVPDTIEPSSMKQAHSPEWYSSILDLTIEEYHSGLWACFIEEGSMVSGTSIFIFQSKKLWKKILSELVPPAGQPPPSAEVAAKTTTAWLQPPTLHRSTTATSSRSTQQTDDATSLVDRQSSAELVCKHCLIVLSFVIKSCV